MFGKRAEPEQVHEPAAVEYKVMGTTGVGLNTGDGQKKLEKMLAIAVADGWTLHSAVGSAAAVYLFPERGTGPIPST